MKQWDQGKGGAKTVSVTQAGVNGGVEEKYEVNGGTLMVNAAIMDEGNGPQNAPWIVELPLSGRK